MDQNNNAVVAGALRTSLIVLMLMGLPLIGFLIYLNVKKARENSIEVPVTLPTTRPPDEQPQPELTTTDLNTSLP